MENSGQRAMTRELNQCLIKDHTHDSVILGFHISWGWSKSLFLNAHCTDTGSHWVFLCRKAHSPPMGVYRHYSLLPLFLLVALQEISDFGPSLGQGESTSNHLSVQTSLKTGQYLPCRVPELLQTNEYYILLFSDCLLWMSYPSFTIVYCVCEDRLFVFLVYRSVGQKELHSDHR